MKAEFGARKPANLYRYAMSMIILTMVVLHSGYGSNATAANDPNSLDDVDCNPKQGTPVTIATAKLYIEHNATDEDTGVHGAFDDHGWSELCVYDPGGKQILAVKPQSQLQDLTMAGIFFESREPPNSEYSVEKLKLNFPEGQYEVRGVNYDGTGLTGLATFSHAIPEKPTIIFPLLAEDEETANEATVSVNNLTVMWERVTHTISGAPVVITGYQIIITKEVDDDPNGFSRPTYDVHVPAHVNSLTVPSEFVENDTVYELEVLALEESGNQTISAGFFLTK